MKSVINFWELLTYLAFWSYGIIYSLYTNYVEQNNIINKHYEDLYLRDIGPGWAFLSRPQDISDIEWLTWKFFIKTSWFYMLLQFCVSECLRRNYPVVLKHWYILSSMIYAIFFLSVKHLLCLVIQPAIFAAIIFLGGSKTIVWITGCVILLSFNSAKNRFYFWGVLDGGNAHYEDVYLLFFGTAWNILRCVSYCIDFVDAREKEKDKEIEQRKPYSKYECLINMFSYVLYLPLLYVGPITLYEQFEASFQETDMKLKPRLKRFVIDMILFAIYSVIMEVVLHFMYFYAFHEKIELIKEMSSLAICGGGIWMGFQFHLKYVISYGTTGAFARLDHMDPPPTPRCIARIHVYSHMWRYFDVGLYRFLVKYIYRPGYSSLSNYINMSKILYKIISSFGTFAFIFIWHGTTWNIFVWSCLNYLGILLEYSAKAIATTEPYQKFKQVILVTEANVVRFEAFTCSFLLLLSIISNFYLFGGTAVGDIYFGLLVWPVWYNFMVIIVMAYCCCHVSMSLKDVPSRTDVKLKRT